MWLEVSKAWAIQFENIVFFRDASFRDVLYNVDGSIKKDEAGKIMRGDLQERTRFNLNGYKYSIDSPIPYRTVKLMMCSPRLREKNFWSLKDLQQTFDEEMVK